MRFQLVILDKDHIILASVKPMMADEHRYVLEAFDRWKERGGALVLSETVVFDRTPTVNFDLLMPGDPGYGGCGNHGCTDASPCHY